MNISTQMLSPADLARTTFDVDKFNKELKAQNSGKSATSELDKDDFLQILVTQLQHQDPTAPMEDREFIAQMAQFSSLEQMTNMSKNFGKLSSVLNSSEAQSLLGRTVEVLDGDKSICGTVSQIVRGEFPLVMVNDTFYDLEQVSKVQY